MRCILILDKLIRIGFRSMDVIYAREMQSHVVISSFGALLCINFGILLVAF